MFQVWIRTIVVAMCCTFLYACSSDDEVVIEENFTVEFSEQTISIEPNQTYTINYTLELDSDFNVTIEIENEPDVAEVTLDTLNSTVTLTATEETSGSFNLIFKSQSLELDKQITYQVENAEDTGEAPTDNSSLDNDQDYIIYFPSDYITIFEDEIITIDLKRNYEINEQVTEEFYFTTDNITGALSIDQTQLLITASTGDEDTYGELTAVTNVNGVLHESKMYIIYYNKNRDLSTQLIQPGFDLLAIANITLQNDIVDILPLPPNSKRHYMKS